MSVEKVVLPEALVSVTYTHSLSLSLSLTHPPTHTHTFNIVLSTAYTPIHTYHTLSAGNELGGDGCGLGDPFDNFGGLVAAYLAVLVSGGEQNGEASIFTIEEELRFAC